jgi:CHAD domain-containing protein
LVFVSQSLQYRASFKYCMVDNQYPMQTVEALCARYSIDIAHAHQAALSAACLFDETQAVHGLKPRARELLMAGAHLLEIGLASGEPDPFTAGRDRVIAAPLAGISPAERAQLACMVAFQRAGASLHAETLFTAQPPAVQHETRVLAALARIAAGLDASRTQSTRIESVLMDPAGILLRVRGPFSHADAAGATQAASLWRDLFGAFRVQGRLDAAGIQRDDTLAVAAQKAIRYRHEWAGGDAAWAMGPAEPLTPRRVSRLRVAVRRMRNDLRLFGDGLRGKIYKPIDIGLRDLSPLLRAARLHDALIENLGEYERHSDEDASDGLKPLMAHWQAGRERAIEKLAAHGAGDDHQEWLEALNAWLAMTDEAKFCRQAGAGEPSHVRHIADAALHAHLRDVRAFDTLPAMPAPEAAHALRVSVKRLRYACEVLPVAGAGDWVARCITAQDVLGAVNDAHEAAAHALAFVAQQQSQSRNAGARNGLKGIVAYAEAQQNVIEARLLDWRACLQPFL